MSNHASFVPDFIGYSGQGAFRFWCQTVLPLVYDDSLSYYELLNKVVTYLNNVISDVSNVETNTESLRNAYNQLENYVNTYFDNLDIQNEINAKLDEMAENGDLNDIISPYVPPVVESWLAEHITPTTPVVDASLSIAGAAADAKATGDKFSVNEALFDNERDWIHSAFDTAARNKLTINVNGINPETGRGVTTTKRCRTYIVNYPERMISVKCSGSGYSVLAYAYDTTGFATATIFRPLTEKQFIDAPCFIALPKPDDCIGYALCFKFDGDVDVTETERTYIHDNIDIYENKPYVKVDETLTVSGEAADSKIVGDNFANVEDESEVAKILLYQTGKSIGLNVRPKLSIRENRNINENSGKPESNKPNRCCTYVVAFHGNTFIECSGNGYEVFTYSFETPNSNIGYLGSPLGKWIKAPCFLALPQVENANAYALSFRISENEETISSDMATYIYNNVNVYLSPTIDVTLTENGNIADALATGNAITLAMPTGEKNISEFLTKARTFFDNRLSEVNGSQAMLYHDGSTILDTTTSHTANIECSTFVTLCLRALGFDDTSYSHVLDNPVSPEYWVNDDDYYWSLNPFKWNVSHLDSGANPSPVRYASAVARWMNERGLAVVVDNKFSNIRAGDILFFSRKSTPGGGWLRPTYYKQINHIGICYNVINSPTYEKVGNSADMSDTSKRYVYIGSESGYENGYWYYYKNSVWNKGDKYIEPTEFPYIHEMIHCSTDETNTTNFIPGYPLFVSNSATATSSQGKGHGSIFIQAIESIRGDSVNGIDTLSLVCRPLPGSIWAEKINMRINEIIASMNH